jgi:hypothetical protein
LSRRTNNIGNNDFRVGDNRKVEKQNRRLKATVFSLSFFSLNFSTGIKTSTMSVEDQKAVIEFVEDVEPHGVHKGGVLVSATGDVQQLPVPSKDVNDPLNWPVWYKTGVIVSCCWFCKDCCCSSMRMVTDLDLAIMSLSVVGGLGAILGLFIETYGAEGVSPTHVVWLSTFPSLFVGIGKSLLVNCHRFYILTWTGNYLILPLGLIYGRRFAAVLAIIVNFVFTIACAVSSSFEQHFAFRIIQGLATGATESVSYI